MYVYDVFVYVVYADGRVCISILHAPGDDPMGYESSSERWSPVQSVEKILLSVVSMLAGKSRTVKEILPRVMIVSLFQDVYCYSSVSPSEGSRCCCTHLNGSVKELNISIYFFFPPITQWCSVSDVLFTGGRGVSDFSVLKYY